MKRFLIVLVILFVLLDVLFKTCAGKKMTDEKAKQEFNKLGLTVKLVTDTMKGGNLHYALTGSDTMPTLLFVHGSPGSWDDYKKYLMDTDLIKHYRVVAIDRPGFGYSTGWQHRRLQDQSDIVGQLLTKLQNGKPLYIIGHSYGGPLVALLAADYPKYIKGVIILAGALDPALEAKEKWRKVVASAPVKYALSETLLNSNQELMDLKQDMIPLQAKLSKITADVWVFHGKKDMLVDVGNAQYINDQFTHARSMHTTYFPKENHFIPWTRMKEIKELLLTLPKQ